MQDALRKKIKRYVPTPVLEAVRSVRRLPPDWSGILKTLRFDESEDVRRRVWEDYGYAGAMVDAYATNDEGIVRKWHHYLPIYDRYLSRFIGQPFKMLEIGVDRGGSLKMWREFFGKDAVIFGIDINPACAQFDGRYGAVRIGSQSDASFLESVVAEMGGLDVVIDDGSHVMSDIRKSLDVLFPKLANGGVYLVEDLHTAYWPQFGGGYHSDSNFFRLVSQICDDMHRWYHQKGMTRPDLSVSCTGIHVHDSIVVLEKNDWPRPTHSEIGVAAS